METNLLKAICNLACYKDNALQKIYKSSIRINAKGEALEYYIKDAFCNSFKIDNMEKKDRIHSEYFSYLGNQNNPPDFLIKGGDAIEVKKTEGIGGYLELNSSYPRQQLFSNDPMITKKCRDNEKWDVKDMLYIAGSLDKNSGDLKLLFIVYGNCYAAEKSVYERIRNRMIEGVSEIKGIELADTKEIGRINKVDPLGITYLRVRGMWGIETPISVFDYLSVVQDVDTRANCNIFALMTDNKYQSFPKDDISVVEKHHDVEVKDIKIKDPDNPAVWLKAKLFKISY